MPLKTIAIAPVATLTVEKDGNDYTRVLNGHSHTVGRTETDHDFFAAYEWDIAASALPQTFRYIEEVELQYWTYNPDNVHEIRIKPVTGSITPSNDTASGLWDRINSAGVFDTIKILDNRKKSITTILGSRGSSAAGQMGTAMRDRTHYSVGIRRKPEGGFGSLSLGGLSLSSNTLWEDAGSGVASPPLLYITYFTAQEDFPSLLMRYTTQEPRATQNTPSNSIGGYRAFNDVYPSVLLGDDVSSTQITIPIGISSVMPTQTGLAAMGTEIFKYEGIDPVARLLTGVTRGIAPAAFPAGQNAYGNLEKVYLLHPDIVNDDIRGTVEVHRLFDTPPTSSLVQYRCVCIYHSGFGSTRDFFVRDPEIHLFQNPNSNVQFDVGIEVPLFNTHTGQHDGVVSDQIFTDANFAGFETGLFAGALVKFTRLDVWRIIDTFDAGEFILSSPLVGIASGDEFIIFPAPSQVILNDSIAPINESDSERFRGFLGDGGTSEVVLNEHSNIMQTYDLFYVWVKRTLVGNVDSSDDTGAILSVQYKDQVDAVEEAS